MRHYALFRTKVIPYGCFHYHTRCLMDNLINTRHNDADEQHHHGHFSLNAAKIENKFETCKRSNKISYSDNVL